jgi:hypothetical protein
MDVTRPAPPCMDDISWKGLVRDETCPCVFLHDVVVYKLPVYVSNGKARRYSNINLPMEHHRDRTVCNPLTPAAVFA